MRFGISSWCAVATLLALACDDGNVNGAPGLGTACGAGQQQCNGQCVPTGTCGSSTNGGGATSGSSQSSKSSQTGGKSSASNGGTSNSEDTQGEGGQGEGGQSEETDTTSAKGGTSPVGGTSAKGGSTTKASTTATGGAVSTYVDDPTKCDDTSTTSGELTGDFVRRKIVIQDPKRDYMAYTNWWGKYVDQVIEVNGVGFSVTKNGAGANGNDPVGFPSIFIGSYEGMTTTGSNLPKKVSEIKSVLTLIDTNIGSINDTSNFNIAYDVWFTSGSAALAKGNIDPGGSGRLMMIWLFKPGNRQPRGSKNGTANLAGKTWDVWQDNAGGSTAPCRSYVAQSKLSAMSQFDLNEFIKHSVDAQFISSSMYLSIVFAGMEIWSGGSGAKINKYCAKVN